MRAARLLHILLLLQNRGRLTAGSLAEELEVSRRTILRDVDALTEAGLPIIVHVGHQGGIELGFGYRTRLTGLDHDEAAALGVILSSLPAQLGALGLGPASARAASKLLESLPDGVRQTAMAAGAEFRIQPGTAETDPRIPALAGAIRGRQIVRIRARSSAPRITHPTALEARPDGWWLHDGLADEWIALAHCADINISAHRFEGD